jgi:hypothetical protein
LWRRWEIGPEFADFLRNVVEAAGVEREIVDPDVSTGKRPIPAA